MADTAAWGGQTELNALCQSLKQHIKVFAVGLPPIDMGSNFIGMILFALALHCLGAQCCLPWVLLSRALRNCR